MSEFDLGFGSAIADKIIEDAEYQNSGVISQTLQDQATKVKVAYREMLLNFENALRERNDKIDAIAALPDGEYKDSKIKEFKAIDDGGWFSPSFATQAAAVQTALNAIGADASLPEVKTLGIIGIDDLVAIPTAAWVAATVSVVSIAALGTYFATQGVRYAAILVNPEGVQQADPTLPALIGGDAGKGIKIGIVILALGGAAYFVMKARSKNA